MNANLSSSQFDQSSMTERGAMPIKDKFNGPAPIKESTVENRMAPNASIHIPKPGFF